MRIEASALCGSERPALMAGVNGNRGHEACGIIIEPGSSTFRIGERVGLAAVIGCRECDRCTAGRELYCVRGPQMSNKSGGWHAEFAAVDISALRELPEHTDPAMGAMISGDPLGVPVRGLRRAPSNDGDRVLIIGLGPVGLSHILVRAFMGAEVIGIGGPSFRRNLALNLGAIEIVKPEQAHKVRPRLIIECSGRPESIEHALNIADYGGMVLQSGECEGTVHINPSSVFVRREVAYTGSWYYATEDYPIMLELMNRGLPLSSLCTHDVPATHAQPAITDFIEGRAGKVVLRWL